MGQKRKVMLRKKVELKQENGISKKRRSVVEWSG